MIGIFIEILNAIFSRGHLSWKYHDQQLFKNCLEKPD
jgi:hypothetical protein|nr:hypothetical protein [Mucilaginibacter sp. X4EP1]